MNNEKETRSFFDWFRNHFASDRKDVALRYLEDHEHSFFQTSQVRIKEITGKLETSVKGALVLKLVCSMPVSRLRWFLIAGENRRGGIHCQGDSLAGSVE